MEDSQEIKQLRQRLELSMRGMGRLLHVSATSVHRWEHGSTPGPFCAAALGRMRERLDAAQADGRGNSVLPKNRTVRIIESGELD